MRIGKVITAIPPDGGEGKYICVAEARDYLWLVPTTGDLSSQHTKFVKTSGPDAWFITGEYEDKPLLEEVMRKLDEYIELADDAMLSPSQAAQAQDNLHALKAASAYSTAFGEGCMIGRIVFVEFPLAGIDEDYSGQYVVIAESDTSLFGISTQCARTGCHWRRIPIRGDKAAKVISIHENDNHIDEVIDWLTDFSIGNEFEDAIYESASTSVWQLKNALEFKSKRRSGPFEICARPIVEVEDEEWLGLDDDFDDDFDDDYDFDDDFEDEDEEENEFENDFDALFDFDRVLFEGMNPQEQEQYMDEFVERMIEDMFSDDEDDEDEEDEELDLNDCLAILDNQLNCRPLNPALTGRRAGMLIG